MMTEEYTEEKRKELDLKVEKMIDNFNPFAFKVLEGRFFEDVKLCMIAAYGEERAAEVYREVIVKHYNRISLKMDEKRKAEFRKRNNL
jgi:methyl coenzyme M reductase subunit D